MARVCKVCGSDQLLCEIVITKYLPLAARGGSVKVGQAKVTKLDLQEAWDREDGKDRKVKSPVICEACGTRYEYHVADADPLKQIGATSG